MSDEHALGMAKHWVRLAEAAVDDGSKPQVAMAYAAIATAWAAYAQATPLPPVTIHNWTGDAEAVERNKRRTGDTGLRPESTVVFVLRPPPVNAIATGSGPANRGVR